MELSWPIQLKLSRISWNLTKFQLSQLIQTILIFIFSIRCLIELKFCEVSRIFFSNRRWKFQLSILKNRWRLLSQFSVKVLVTATWHIYNYLVYLPLFDMSDPKLEIRRMRIANITHNQSFDQCKMKVLEVFSFSSIDLAFWCFVVLFFHVVCKISNFKSIWRNLLVLSKVGD